MPGLADFHFGARVVSRDGREVGSLHRLVVQEEGLDPRAIVVKEGARFSGRLLAPGSWYLVDDVLIDVAAVASADRERVELRLTAAEVRRQPPYLSYTYRPLTRGQAAAAQLGLLLPGTVEAPNLEEHARKRSDELEIEEGENVMLGRTGRRLGHVRDVLVDEGELVGIVLRPEGFFKEDVVLPVRFLERGDDLALFAQLSERDLEELKPFRPDGG